MLLKLRGGLDSFFVTVLLGLLIGSFAIFGIGSSVFTSNNQQIATVGDTVVPTQQYANRVQQRAQTLQGQFGAQFTAPQLIRMMGLDQQILQQMIAEAALSEHLSSLGMRAGNKELRAELETYEGFVLPDGTLSRDMVLQALNNTGLSRAEFMNQVRRSISQRNLVATFEAENMMPRDYAEALYVWQAERRRATMIDIKAADIESISDPLESDLLAYFELNKGAYVTEERRSYKYVLVTPQQFLTEIEVAEDKILEEYESRSAEFKRAERRGLQQVSFDSQAAADAFLVAVSSGADFVEAGASVTSFTAEEIELGEFELTEAATDFGEASADAIFALELGSVSAPLERFGAWNIYKVASITEAEESSLEDVREQVTTSLKLIEAEDRLYDMVDTVALAMGEETALASIATAANLPLASVSAVNARGISPSGDTAVTQAEEYTILREAFTKELSVEADMIDIDPTDPSKGFYLVEVATIDEPTERALEDVRMQVVAAWTREKMLERAATIAETAKSSLASGEDPETVALSINATSFEAKNVARTADEGSSLAPSIRQLIFELDKGEVDYERTADGDGYVVIRVDEVTPGDPSTRKEAVDTLLAQLNTQAVDEIFAQYQGYLMSNYPIKINTVLQQSLFAETPQQ